jgi:hypothetical protein
MLANHAGELSPWLCSSGRFSANNSKSGAILLLLGADHNPRLIKTVGSAHFLAYPGAGL